MAEFAAWTAAFSRHANAPIVWVSLINEGYLGFARHFQRNLQRLGAAMPLVVACTDDAALEGARALGMAAVGLRDALGGGLRSADAVQPALDTQLLSWATPSYRAMTFAKIDALHVGMAAARAAGVGLLGFIDFDVALLADPTPPVLAAAAARPDVAVLAQCEEGTRGPCGQTAAAPCPNLCSGVLVLRTTASEAADACLRYTESGMQRHMCDQGYLQEAWDARGVARASLDRAAFPNGARAGVREHAVRPPLDGAVLVHFNWLVAADKEPKMRAWGLWCGDDAAPLPALPAPPLRAALVGAYAWDRMSERAWYEAELALPPPTPFRPEDAPETALLVLGTPAPAADVAAVVAAARAGRMRRFGILHLGDEFLGAVPPTWSNGRELYDLPQCAWVLRHYYDPALSPAVTTIPLGPMRATRPPRGVARDLAWSFAGDPRKAQRAEALAAFAALVPHAVHLTSGWLAADALEDEAYAALLARSAFVLCPPGNFNQECFRVYEALHAGAIPVVLRATPAQPFDYWDACLGAGHPLLVGDTWADCAAAAAALWADAAALEARLARAAAWWAAKRAETRGLVAARCAALASSIARAAVATPTPQM